MKMTIIVIIITNDECFFFYRAHAQQGHSNLFIRLFIVIKRAWKTKLGFVKLVGLWQKMAVW